LRHAVESTDKTQYSYEDWKSLCIKTVEKVIADKQSLQSTYDRCKSLMQLCVANGGNLEAAKQSIQIHRKRMNDDGTEGH